MATESPIQKAATIRQQTRDLIAGFLKVEVEVSLTFAEAALDAEHDSEKRLRNEVAARKGYDTLRRYLGRYPAPLDRNFRVRLDRLKAALEALGETEL